MVPIILIQSTTVLKEFFEEIMQSEAEELICASRYERSEERKDQRNGKRKRTVEARVGEIDKYTKNFSPDP